MKWIKKVIDNAVIKQVLMTMFYLGMALVFHLIGYNKETIIIIMICFGLGCSYSKK